MPMNNNDKVLVVGTTSDYIEWIRLANPGRAIFLTAAENRENTKEPEPHPSEEILCCLDDSKKAKNEIISHLHRWRMSINGIACFDCESMELAAYLAKEFSLPYPTIESIRLCRDKFISKTAWQKNGVPCPRFQLVQSSDEVHSFFKELDGPCVLKPVTGSGSELVFQCLNRKDCEQSTQHILEGLKCRESQPLYSKAISWFLAEEFIPGDEYSCDFIIQDDSVQIIRLTKKIKNNYKPFGTISAYLLSDCDSEGIHKKNLEKTLHNGAKTLGISDAICMVDFIVCEEKIFLLEITPRPGGDCIPYLLKRSVPLDILTYTLDFAQRRIKGLPKSYNGQYAALRMHAKNSGKINNIDSQLLVQDSRVLEIHSTRQPGHNINMPPNDYDSWNLGHIIFNPLPGIALEAQAQDLRNKLIVEIEDAS